MTRDSAKVSSGNSSGRNSRARNDIFDDSRRAIILQPQDSAAGESARATGTFALRFGHSRLKCSLEFIRLRQFLYVCSCSPASTISYFAI